MTEANRTDSTSTSTATKMDMAQFAKAVEELSDSAFKKVRTLRSDSEIAAAVILYADDPQEAMRILFDAFRGPYASAKLASAKLELTDRSAAWNNTKSALRYWLTDKGGMVPSWPNLRSGLGDCTLTPKKVHAEERKAERAAQGERDSADALHAQQQQQQAELEAIRSLTLEDLVTQIETLLAASSHETSAVIKALASNAGLTATAKRTRKAVAKKVA